MSSLFVHRIDDFSFGPACLCFRPLHQPWCAVEIVQLHIAESYSLFRYALEKHLVVRCDDEGGEVLERLQVPLEPKDSFEVLVSAIPRPHLTMKLLGSSSSKRSVGASRAEASRHRDRHPPDSAEN